MLLSPLGGGDLRGGLSLPLLKVPVGELADGMGMVLLLLKGLLSPGLPTGT